jgi:hypothetical protein
MEKEYFMANPNDPFLSVPNQLLIEYVENGIKRLADNQIYSLRQFGFIDDEFDPYTGKNLGTRLTPAGKQQYAFLKESW